MTQPLDLDLDPIEQRREYYLARRSSRSCPAHPSADDVPGLLAEVRWLRAELDGRRDQVLAEAAEIASGVIGPLWHLDTLHEIHARLLAACTTATQES